MSADPHAYKELNQHHANLDAERSHGLEPTRPRTAPTIDRAAKAPELSPEQKRRAQVVAQRDQQWREDFGDDAVRPASYLAEEQRILVSGKDFETEKEDLYDLYRREKALEQDRRARALYLEARNDAKNQHQTALQHDQQSSPTQSKDQERQARVDTRVKQYQAFHSAHRERDGEREH